MRYPALSFGLAVVLAGSAAAATLRSMTLLDAPVVKLSDLFDDAGPNADRVLGPAPGPGGRIVVEAPQLAAIARQFEADWKPVSSADRAVLERPGRMLPREDMLAAVKAALVAAGASPDCEIQLPGVTPPLIPVAARPRPVASQLEYDSASGRFALLLSVTGVGMEPVNLRIAGHVDDTVELPVAAGRLLAGTVLRPSDVRLARVHVVLVRGEVVHAVGDAIGMQLRHSLAAGQPLAMAELARPASVQRGALVQMVLDSAGIAVTAQGIAQEAGAMGERIRVMNPSSRAVVEAEVIGPDRVRVMPDSAPITLAGRGLALSAQ
jgi:flagella basal body P-ring formation protein FlgA